MKIKEVRFEKLFSLEKYHNERIGFVADVNDNDNPQKVAGELFFEIMNIEDCLNTYRNLLYHEGMLASEISNIEEGIARTKQHMAEMKTKVEELSAKIDKGGDVSEEKLRHACESKSYKQLKSELNERENSLSKANELFKQTVKATEELKNRIKKGNFSLEGIEQPKRYHSIHLY